MKWVGTYADYLQSPYWRLHVRPRILARAAGTCEWCGGDYQLEVHHLTYERMGHELDEDLFALCARCHGIEHGIARTPTLKRGPVPIDGILTRLGIAHDTDRYA